MSFELTKEEYDMLWAAALWLREKSSHRFDDEEYKGYDSNHHIARTLEDWADSHYLGEGVSEKMNEPQPLTKEDLGSRNCTTETRDKVLSALKGLKECIIQQAFKDDECYNCDACGLLQNRYVLDKANIYCMVCWIDKWFPILNEASLHEHKDSKSSLLQSLNSGEYCRGKSSDGSSSVPQAEETANGVNVIGGSEIDEQHSFIANAIHWPECWDTMAYPTILDALWEIVEVKGICPTCKKGIPCLPKDLIWEEFDRKDKSFSQPSSRVRSTGTGNVGGLETSEQCGDAGELSGSDSVRKPLSATDVKDAPRKGVCCSTYEDNDMIVNCELLQGHEGEHRVHGRNGFHWKDGSEKQ